MDTTVAADRRVRPKRSSSVVKVVSYEGTMAGIPPITQSSSLRSETSQPPRSIPLSEEEFKRDSAFAPSVSTTTRDVEKPLPTIVVHDEESPDLQDHSVIGKSMMMGGELPRDTEPASSLGHQRINSFHGIETTIDTSSADVIDLDDLATDKITFSQRGSLMFGGKKMQDLIAAKGPAEDRSRADGVTSPVPAFEKETYPHKQTERPQTPRASPGSPKSIQSGDKPRPGLVAGKRKPSIAMLQAAIQDGRVLSAEEITFSRKVRSMYDHGDERAAQWTSSIDGNLSAKSSPSFNGKDSTTPDPPNGDLQVYKHRRPSSRHSSKHSLHRNSFYAREATELAGGIEDWGDINGRNVDRYGFIHQDRTVSRSSVASSGHEIGTGMQRVATSLRVEAQQLRGERKLKRGPSSIRSSRSVPPRTSGDLGGTKRPGSVYSVQSNTPKSNLFRSRSRRALAEAPDMFSLPPHLADINEDENVGKTASALKQREWAREEKWQKMARPVRHRADGKGGGMRFEFDTTDSKVIERTWKGIPDRWRATAWHSFLSASAKKRNSPTTDEELTGQFHKLQEMNCADDVQIDVDVPRTVNLHIMFRRRYRGGQRLLFRVLHAVSLYFPDIGYVQGMASLAATLLCYFDEEKAFVMMVRLWQLRGLEQLFENGFAGLMTCLSEFETDWLRGGDVAEKLLELGITSTAYGTRWYLTLFNMSMPFPAQLRVWDVFMLLGDRLDMEKGAFGGADLDILHATSAALIDATRDIILDSDFENAMKVLTSFVPIKDEDVLMRVAKTEWKMKKKRSGGK